MKGLEASMNAGMIGWEMVSSNRHVLRVCCAAQHGPGSIVTGLLHGVGISGHMDKMRVVDTLGCLAQATRLEVFRLLVAAEPEGLAAGEIAQTLGIPHNTLSNHLAILTRAELAWGERRSRSVVYRASLATFSQALMYLINDCCGGRSEICISLVSGLGPNCAPKEKRHA